MKQLLKYSFEGTIIISLLAIIFSSNASVSPSRKMFQWWPGNDTIISQGGDTIISTVNDKGDTIYRNFAGKIVDKIENIEDGVSFDFSRLEEQLEARSRKKEAEDTIKNDSTNDLRYPFDDNYSNPFLNEKQSPLYFNNPSNYSSSVEYDVTTNEYIFSDKIGNLTVKQPYSMTIDQYREFDLDRATKSYWSERYQSENFERDGSLWNPKLYIGSDAFSHIFGTNTIDIKPQGTAELTFGINISKTENPTLSVKQQRSVTFDFDEKIQMGVTGQIGDKMQLGINYNTKATFDFENETKLAYTGKEDEIIQSIEAGNVSLPLTSTLISGSQSLFGFKTELKFGNLSVTSVLSQQKAESSEITVENGAMINEFEVEVGDYDANKHFFLSHYFRDNYDAALSSLPLITSGVVITKIEVWVTNKTSSYTDSRNILAFMDLGEKGDNIYATDFVKDNSGVDYPRNKANTLYEKILSKYSIRDVSQISSSLYSLSSQYDFKSGQDYEKVQDARLLSSSEYTVNTTLGYISLNSALNSDEVLGVAFQYTKGGKVYKVGEFASAIADPNTLVVKLLKGTSLTPKFKTWDLMMKNVYALGAYQIDSEDFELNVLYENDMTGTSVNYITAGPKPPDGINGKVLLKVFDLDNINSNEDQSPDGQFDFLSGVTINTSTGRIFFPHVEPFGSYLREQMTQGAETESEELKYDAIADQYVYEELYDSTQTVALELAEKNKFVLKGSYLSSSGSEISLNAMNIPDGSVTVTAGGTVLEENVDYTVDYNLGRVTILNESILESASQIKISLESTALFNIGTKTLVGSHFDYKFSDNFNVGGTLLRLNEKPLTSKVNYGEEPICNTMFGLDGSYSTELPILTKIIDKLPFIETKEKSTISFDGEYARLIPGVSNAIDDDGGTAYIDDFEGSETEINLKTYTSWKLSSTPQIQAEAELFDDLAYNYNRAKLAWYTISTDLLRSSAPSHISEDDQSNHWVREVYEQDIFPNVDTENGYPTTEYILNLAYYPKERGQYNYVTADQTIDGQHYYGLTNDGSLDHPEERWGGIMRSLSTNDFEANNIEFIEFWLMDPFVYDEDSTIDRTDSDNPALYINLGSISEDILKDSQKSQEHALPTTEDEQVYLDTTTWGVVSSLQPSTTAFDNDADNRKLQDVGLDGLDDDSEVDFFTDYLQTISRNFGSEVYDDIADDPSGDNYHFYKGSDYDSDKISILERYKKFNGVDGNSPVSGESGESYSTSATLVPDVEDINSDNTLSETESYYQYKISLDPDDFVVGENYITDKVVDETERRNDKTTSVTWYQFKVPIFDPDETIGSIQDFESIRFIRMFLKGLDEKMILRFAEFNLIKGEWRQYDYDLSIADENQQTPQLSEASLDISSVNIEENNTRTPVNYVLPPGFDREIDPTNSQLTELNEQSLVMTVENLEDGDARAAYKSIYLDMRQYNKLRMEIHAEAIDEDMLEDDEVRAFIRLGSDFTENYYEYEVPLKLTPHITESNFYNNNSESDREIVWPEDNQIILPFDVLTDVKQLRNESMQTNSNVTYTTRYTYSYEGNKITVVGSPNLGNVKTFMMGIRNPLDADNDDGEVKSVEVWFNELRLTDFEQTGGWAATARVTAKLADFATINMSGNTSTPGFGSIDETVSERQQEYIYEYDLNSTVQLGKFFPQKANVQIPLYVGLSQSIINPLYDPQNPDIELSETLDNCKTQAERDSIKYISQELTRRRSINLTNVKIAGSGSEQHFYSLSNWTASYAYSDVYFRDINTEYNITRNRSGSLSYLYNNKTKNVTPFSKIFKRKFWAILKDFNFYYAPKQIGFSTSFDRSYEATQTRNLDSDSDIEIDPTYDKDFTWDRVYDLKWDLSKNLKLDFSANNIARIDEADGWLDKDSSDYYLKRDTLWGNISDFWSLNGYNTDYNHTINATYNVPVNKLPLLNWVKLTARYTGTYDWIRGSEAVEDDDGNLIDYGNTIQNSNKKQLSSSLALRNIYKNIGFLKTIDQKYSGKSSSRKTKQIKTVTYEDKDIKLKANVPRVISHKLKTEKVQIKVTGKPKIAKDAKTNTKKGKIKSVEVKGKLEVVNENKVKFTAFEDYDNVEIVITGKREVQDNLARIIGESLVATLISIKSVSLNYSETNSTTLPGYKPETRILGMIDYNGERSPTIPFILGFQDDDIANTAAQKGWLVSEDGLTSAFAMTESNQFSYRAQVEPLKGLSISINGKRVSSNSFQEYWLPDSLDGTTLTAYSTTLAGNYSKTINTLRTSFQKLDDQDNIKAYSDFEDYRLQVAWRLAKDRPSEYDDGTGTIVEYDMDEPNYYPYADSVRNDSFPNGYGPTSQDAVLPAFLAAYTGKSPDEISLDIIPENKSIFREILDDIPIPNWKITFDGLVAFKGLKDYLKTFSITHSYTSSFSISSYETNQEYDFTQKDLNGYSYAIDETNNYFFSEYEIAGATITESFSPLIDVNLQWDNELQTHLSYSRSRQISLSFTNNRINEVYNRDYVFGAGYTFKDVKIGIKTASGIKNFQSDLILSADVTISDITNILRYLDEDVSYSNEQAGSTNTSITLNADYDLSERFSLRLYYEHTINTPKISTSYPTSNIQAGVTVRFTLIP